jgi:peptide/nickel transport system permease protein
MATFRIRADGRPLGSMSKPGGILARAGALWRTRIGFGLVLIVGLLALFGPAIAPHGPADFVGVPNSGPSATAVFGTDYLGQDVWSRFLYGGEEILLLAVFATLIGLLVGTGVGLLAAYSPGLPDEVLMRGMDAIMAFPTIVLALVVISALGPAGWLIVIAVGLAHVPRVARVVRGAALPIVERDFVAVAEAIGLPRWRILLGEIVPNVVGPLMVEANLRLTFSIGLIAALAFLGFTPHPNGADWGLMIQENQTALVVQPWGVVLPMLAVALLTVGTGLIGDGIARSAAGIDRASHRR